MHFPRLVLVLSLLLPVTAQAGGDRVRSFGARFVSTHGSCAAQFMSKAWGIPPFRAAQRGGRLAYTEGDGKLAKAVSSARQAYGDMVWCDPAESRIAWQDMEALAHFWHLDDYDTKTRVQDKLRWGADAWLRTEVAAAHAATDGMGDLAGLFLSKGYSLCDASVLAAFWHVESWDAKLKAGQKLGDGQDFALRTALADARSSLMPRASELCWWFEQWSYDELEALSAHWGTDIGETKARLETKLFWGEVAVVDAALLEIRGRGGYGGDTEEYEGWFPDEDPLGAFFGSDYSYCDAWLYSKAWDTSIESAKTEIGYKVTSGAVGDILDGLARGRTTLRAVGTDRCEHDWGGLSYSDVTTLASRWGMETESAKAIVERRLFDGDRVALLTELGRR